MSDGPFYLEEGDHAFIGPASPNKVHWVVDSFCEGGLVHLSSGMTGRRTTAHIDSLTFHSKGSSA